MGMFDAMDTAVSGATASRVWLDAIADNVANINTVHPAGEEPFQARLVYMTEQRNADGSGAGVLATAVEQSGVPPTLVFDPAHPFADENGNVAMANVDLGVEMTNLLLAERGYQANLRVVEQARDAYRSALQIGSR
jgi:flagellar basal-body rod protein FlgC